MSLLHKAKPVLQEAVQSRWGIADGGQDNSLAWEAAGRVGLQGCPQQKEGLILLDN